MPAPFGLQVPYEIVPTGHAGVYVSPTPPADFDPLTADPASLAAHGFPLPRPGKGDDPALVAAWRRLFARPWQSADRFVDGLAPRTGITHGLAGARTVANAAGPLSQWAGVAIPGGWRGALGSWQVPTVSKSAAPQGPAGGWNSTSWVGIDGKFGSTDVLQAGVQQRVDASGNATYAAWYEWFAAPQPDSPPYVFQTDIPNFVIRPGDTVFCLIRYVNQAAGQLFFANDTLDQRFSITLAPPPGATFDGSSAEWIVEAPVEGESNASLPVFTPVQFTDAICWGASASGAAIGEAAVLIGDPGDPRAGETMDILGLGSRQLTSTTRGGRGSHAVTITYIGPSSWIDNDLTALSRGVPSATHSALDGYRQATDSSQHVNFVSTDGHIHELFNHPFAGWVDNDLTAASGGVPAASGSPLDGYWQVPDDSQHIHFIAADGHIHELFIHPSAPWVDNDLTVVSGGVPAAPGSALHGYWQAPDDSQHVHYISTDRHVHELFIHRDARWVDNDLTAVSGGALAAAGSALDGYWQVSDNSQHVNFLSVDGHVHELFFNGTRWTDNDLTTISGGALAAAGSAIDGYWQEFDNSQHVHYISTDGHVHELFFNGTRWTDNDLTTISGGVPAATGSSLDGYWDSANSQHINFISDNGHVHELFFRPFGQWVDNDLTAAAGTTSHSTFSDSPLDGYWDGNNSQHVNYIAPDGHVHELFSP